MEPSSSEEDGHYNRAVKSVIKKQLKELLQQLGESGSEVAVMTIDLEDNTCSHFGTEKGQSFIEQNQLVSNFFDFCNSDSKAQSADVPGEKITPCLEDKSNTPKETPKTVPERKLPVKPKPVKAIATPAVGTSDVLKFDLPQKYTKTMSENEAAGLVGRIVATQLVTTKQRGDAAGSTMKFKTLLEAANKALKKDKNPAVETSPVKPPSTPSTPGSTRSGRKVSSKFLESINSLKKQPKIKEDGTESGELEDKFHAKEEDVDIIEEICSIEPSILKRVRVKSIDGKLVDLQMTSLDRTPELETLAILLIHELDLLVKRHHIFTHKFVKVMITSEANDTDAGVKAEVVKADWSLEASKATDSQAQKSGKEDQSMNLEEMDETEESDLREELGEFYTEMAPLSDPDYTPDGKLQKGSVKIGRVARVPTKNYSPSGLVRRPKARHYTETMPVECQHCGITLTGRSNLKSHIKRVHMHIKNFNCSICRHGFWSNNALESHMLSVHTRQCEACQEYVVESVPWSLGLTMRTRRDVICTCGSIVSICSTFGRKRMYLRDDEPDEDGNIYQKRPKNNTGTKYACGTCGKLFMKKSNCERHSRKHTDIKNCVCDICGTAYMYESSLKKHMASEHGVVRHVCEICNGNYASLTALKVHIVKAHRNITIDENDVGFVLKRKVKQEDQSTVDLEALEEEMMENDEVSEDQPEIIVNGSSGEVIVHHKGREILNKIQSPGDEVNHDQSIVISESVMETDQGEQVILSQAEEMSTSDGQIVLNQGGHIVVSSDGTDQTTAQLVQQVIDGQVVGQNGGMSIIIKQIPVENEIF